MNKLDEIRKSLEHIKKQLDAIESIENKKAELESKMSDLFKNFYVDTGLKIDMVQPKYEFKAFHTGRIGNPYKRNKLFDVLSCINIDIEYF